MGIVRRIKSIVYDPEGEKVLESMHLAHDTADAIRAKAREWGVSSEAVVIACLERSYGKNAKKEAV